MIEYKGIESFWNFIKKENGKNFRRLNVEEFKIFKDNKIISLDENRWFAHKDNLLHLVNSDGLLLSPSYFEINIYDLMFGNIIGNENAYNILEKRIFKICSQQIKNENNIPNQLKLKLDNIIDEIKEGEYGKIDESYFSFIDIYPYLASNGFFLRDMTAIEKTKDNPIQYDDSYGGRCLSLFSMKKILIEGVPIPESTYEYEKDKSGTTNLKTIMTKYGIPRNDCLSTVTKRYKGIDECWNESDCIEKTKT